MKSLSSGQASSGNPIFSKNTPYVEIQERVRYSETDQMGVAHNKQYFEWFEIGRTEFCRKNGISYQDIEKKGYFLVVAESFCKYKKPLRYDEEIAIRIYLRESSPKKFIFDYQIFSIPKKQLAAEGYTVHVTTNKSAKVTPLPDDIYNKINPVKY